MIRFSSKGDFSKTIKFMDKVYDKTILKILEKYGHQGVEALAEATPKDTGKTAASWGFEIRTEPGLYKITWFNTNTIKDYANVALLLQYGHGTRNGGYVQGRDYINPALKPVFDRIAEEAWREVTE